MISAFGVDHGDSVSKAVSASERKTRKDKNYRKSMYYGMNPRSRTYVKHGTSVERIAVPVAGGAVLGPIGQSAGMTRNVMSDDVRSYHKKTGRKAKAKIGGGMTAFNIYEKKK